LHEFCVACRKCHWAATGCGATVNRAREPTWVGRGQGIPVGVLGSLSAWPSDWSLHRTHGQHVMSLMVTVLVLGLAGKAAGSPTASHGWRCFTVREGAVMWEKQHD
jgi:hypothetical protein